MAISDLLSRHQIQILQVLPPLLPLELRNCDLSMINSKEIYEFFVVFDIFVGYFDGCLKIQDVILFGRLALEDGFEGGLALTEFL